MAVAVAEFIGAAIAGADCSVSISVCADASQCVGNGVPCSGPGIPQTLACCSASQVCAALFGAEVFRCRSRASAAAFASAEVLECPRP